MGKRLGEGDVVKVSCERFPTRRMNEVWLSDLVGKLVREARVGFSISFSLTSLLRLCF